MATWTYLEVFMGASPGASWDDDHAQEIIDNVNAVDNEIVDDNFASASSLTLITFADAGNTDYNILITPVTATPAAVGVVSFDPVDATSANIYNSGSSTCAFKATIIKSA